MQNAGKRELRLPGSGFPRLRARPELLRQLMGCAIEKALGQFRKKEKCAEKSEHGNCVQLSS